uniref:phosphoinositide phospholipase C n=1 Tax=Guillardia theta (strain CCMP2712) TaxID=905079 RepID=A0A0C3SGL0_GUITC
MPVCVLSCQRLPNNEASSDILDPYVQVELSGAPGDSQVKRTVTIQDNGFNPVFGGGRGEAFEFEIQEREVAMLKILVMDEDISTFTVVGQCCIPVTCIRPGYRHVTLYDTHNGTLHYSGVLCKFSIENI